MTQISFLDLRNGGTTSGPFTSYVGGSGQISLGAMRGAVIYDINGNQYIAPSTNLGIGFFLNGYQTQNPTGGTGSGGGNQDQGGPG